MPPNRAMKRVKDIIFADAQEGLGVPVESKQISSHHEPENGDEEATLERGEVVQTVLA